MLKKIFELRKEEIYRGSFILLITIGIFNFLNYLFHFSMARLLGPADYGILAVLMSVVYIFSISSQGILTVMSRYTSKLNIRREFGKIKYLLTRGLRKLVFFSFLLLLVYIPIALFISYFAKIEPGLLIFTGLLVFGFLLMPGLRGVIQGRKKFKSLGASMIIESFLKLVIAIVLVILGLRVYGAMGGLISGVLMALLISFGFLRKVLKAKIQKYKIEGVHGYVFPAMIVTLAVILMASLDIIFARRFFPPELAGKYAVASMFGKMIFFGTSAIDRAMFPITSESHDKEDKNKTKSIFKKAFLIVLGICIIAVVVYWLFPKLIISILFGSQYVGVSNILIFIGLAFSFISLTRLSLMYRLATYKKRISFFFFFVLLEIVALSLFHQNLVQFSLALMITNFIMFIVALLFAIKD